MMLYLPCTGPPLLQHSFTIHSVIDDLQLHEVCVRSFCLYGFVQEEPDCFCHVGVRGCGACAIVSD